MYLDGRCFSFINDGVLINKGTVDILKNISSLYVFIFVLLISMRPYKNKATCHNDSCE